MSIGWSEGELGYQQMHLACQEAKAKGILVVSSSIGREFGLFFHGLGRGPLDPPDSADSFTPGLWWAQSFFEGRLWDLSDHLLVPMDSRTIASPSGTEDYVFYRQGGWSWSIPWIAGLYALACQVDSEVTPDRFWETALRTGKTIEIERDGKKYSLGKIADPKSLIDALQIEWFASSREQAN
jgi:hypothetical protein